MKSNKFNFFFGTDVGGVGWEPDLNFEEVDLPTLSKRSSPRPAGYKIEGRVEMLLR
jgi:hypothetical protein